MADPMDEAGPDGATPAAAWRVPDTLLILFVLALVAWAACFVPPYLALVDLGGLTRAAPEQIC